MLIVLRIPHPRRIVPIFALALLVGLSASIVACGAEKSDSQKEAERLVKSRDDQVYVMQNDVEFQNYNRRMQLADDPTTILWCTSAFSTPGSPLFTVPVIGKLTSGNKRPYPTEIVDAGDGESYFSELPGPDGMFGTSGDYRYGFTPTDAYADWYNIETFCTTEPTVWQKESTVIVMESDPGLLEAQERAREALVRGDKEEAERILAEAISAAQ